MHGLITLYFCVFLVSSSTATVVYIADSVIIHRLMYRVAQKSKLICYTHNFELNTGWSPIVTSDNYQETLTVIHLKKLLMLSKQTNRLSASSLWLIRLTGLVSEVWALTAGQLTTANSNWWWRLPTPDDFTSGWSTCIPVKSFTNIVDLNMTQLWCSSVKVYHRQMNNK